MDIRDVDLRQHNLTRGGFSVKSTVKSYTTKVKNRFDRISRPRTNKKDSEKDDILYPLVSVGDSRYVISKYSTLSAIIRALSVDVCYNEYVFARLNDTSYNNDELQAFWKRNKSELKKAESDNLGFGFGGMEIIFDEDTNLPAKLSQIPAETLTIKQIRFNGNTYHFARYNYDGDEKIFCITREDYTGLPEEYNIGIDGWVMWLGGGTESKWYSKPIWYSAYNDLLTAIRKKELDYNTIQNDNIPKAVLFIEAPPDNPRDGEMGIYDSLKQQFADSEGGIAISYFETPMDVDILKTEYIKIQDDNFQYLNELIKQTDNSLLSLYRVPTIRLMIDNNKESLNSNKSQTVYEIYTLDLESYQYPIEEEIDILTTLFYEKDIYCEIKTPIFVDNKHIQAQTILEFYDVGILELGDTLKMVRRLFPEHDWSEIDWNDPELAQRFYHGMLFSTPGVDTGMRNIVGQNIRGEFHDEGAYDTNNKEADGGEENDSSINLYGR